MIVQMKNCQCDICTPLIYVHVQLILKKKDKIGQGQCGHIHVCENVFKIFFSTPTAMGI